ncbi:hypothetical protein DPMN_011054 [Dreissena polymorpha]|uniref:Uncharacterized protein n=1 Tax=Dreissena polymorpha TaxID=45954 RepID=A0A9D4RZV6_DREPO|nr:hypothetical protein DPMN_011054 [Dreissena polymorpha]
MDMVNVSNMNSFGCRCSFQIQEVVGEEVMLQILAVAVVEYPFPMVVVAGVSLVSHFLVVEAVVVATVVDGLPRRSTDVEEEEEG